jgi:hypothetical protein
MSHDMATNKQYCSVTWHRNCSLTGRDEKIQDRDDMGYAHLSAQYTERDIYIWNYDMSSTPARSCSHMSTWDHMELSVDVLICLGDLPRQCFNLSKYYSINELSCVIFYCIISNHTISYYITIRLLLLLTSPLLLLLLLLLLWLLLLLLLYQSISHHIISLHIIS